MQLIVPLAMPLITVPITTRVKALGAPAETPIVLLLVINSPRTPSMKPEIA